MPAPAEQTGQRSLGIGGRQEDEAARSGDAGERVDELCRGGYVLDHIKHGNYIEGWGLPGRQIGERDRLDPEGRQIKGGEERRRWLDARYRARALATKPPDQL